MKNWMVLVLMIIAVACEKSPVEDRLEIITSDTIRAIEFERMVLLEPFTSTSCGACPLAHYEIENLEATNENVMHLTHYLFGPLHHKYTDYVIERLDKTLYTPLSFIQRVNGDAGVVYFGMDRLNEMVEGVERDAVNLGVTIETNLDAQDLTIDVLLESNDVSLESIGLTVLIVEDLVTGEGTGYDQRNYGNEDENHPYFGQGEYIEGFEHTNVIRHVLSGFEGDEVNIESQEGRWSVIFDTDNLRSDVGEYTVIAFATESARVGSPILNAGKLSL
jgi:hypothetical protein